MMIKTVNLNMHKFLNFYLICICTNYYLTNCAEVIDCDKSRNKIVNQIFVKKVNYYRSLHKVDPLILNDELILGASEKSRKLAEDGSQDSRSEEYGENTYKSLGAGPYDSSKLNVIKTWYDEIDDYRGKYDDETRNFTQLVWKETKKMGCGICIKESEDTFITCLFSPRGNFKESFDQNILPAIANPTPLPQRILTPNDGEVPLWWSITDRNTSDTERPSTKFRFSTILYEEAEGTENIGYLTTQSKVCEVTLSERGDHQFTTPSEVRRCVRILFFTTILVTSLAVFSLIILIIKHGYWWRL